MQRYDPGDSADLRHLVRDLDGAPVAADVTFELTRPDGTTATIAPTTSAVGTYDVTVPKASMSQLGRYRYEWIVDGNVDDTKSGAFYVAEADVDELPPLVDIDKLFAKIGYVPDGYELTRAAELLDEASELVRDVAEKTWTDDTTGVVSGVPRRVRVIVVEAAYRAFTNPEGLSQRTIGDSSKSWDRAGREGGEIVYLTTEEERAIRKAAGASSLVVATLASPYGGALVDPWVAVNAQ
jgi:hypothetical protein